MGPETSPVVSNPRLLYFDYACDLGRGRVLVDGTCNACALRLQDAAARARIATCQHLLVLI